MYGLRTLQPGDPSVSVGINRALRKAAILRYAHEDIQAAVHGIGMVMDDNVPITGLARASSRFFAVLAIQHRGYEYLGCGDTTEGTMRCGSHREDAAGNRKREYCARCIPDRLTQLKAAVAFHEGAVDGLQKRGALPSIVAAHYRAAQKAKQALKDHPIWEAVRAQQQHAEA